MTKLPGAGLLNSMFRRVDSLFRVMTIGFGVAALGTALAFALGKRTTGPLAEAAVYLVVSGMAVVFAAGSLRFVAVVLKLWRRMRD